MTIDRAPALMFCALTIGVTHLLTACGGDASAGAAMEQTMLEVTRIAADEKKSLSLATGIEMHFVERGNPDGEAVLFLHGYTDTGRSWFPVMERLEQLRPELRLIALDQRGHGASSLPDAAACATHPGSCFAADDFAADAIAFMNVMNISRAHIVGHSLGSFVAQELALTHPDRIGRIVLSATAASINGNPLLQEFLMDGLVFGPWKESLEQQGYTWPDDVYHMTPLDVDSAMGEWLAANWVTEISADPAYLADIAVETSATTMAAWIGVIQGIHDLDNTKRLESLAVPTLVLWPTQDVFFTAEDQSRLLAALDVAAAQCTASWIWKQYGKVALPESGMQESDIGHNMQWGAPDAVAEDIASYLHDGSVPATLIFADPAHPQSLRSESASPESLRTSRDCRAAS